MKPLSTKRSQYMPRGTDLDAVTIRGSSNNFRMSDVVNMLEYPTKNGKAGWVTIRLFGPVYSDAFFWAKAKQAVIIKAADKRIFFIYSCFLVSFLFPVSANTAGTRCSIPPLPARKRSCAACPEICRNRHFSGRKLTNF